VLSLFSSPSFRPPDPWPLALRQFHALRTPLTSWQLPLERWRLLVIKRCDLCPRPRARPPFIPPLAIGLHFGALMRPPAVAMENRWNRTSAVLFAPPGHTLELGTLYFKTHHWRNCHDKYTEQLKYCKPSGVSLTTFVPQEAVIIVS